MAVTVARVHLAMANAALPGLLPTPPKSAMLPSPSACIPIIPPAKSSAKSKPGRADAVERWDAHKTLPGSPSPSLSSSSSSGSSPRSASSTSGNPERASSCERWDSKKKKCPGITSSPPASNSSASSRAPSSGKKKCDSNSKCSVSRASSAERWDLQKKPRAHGNGGGGMRSGDCKKTMDKRMTAPPAIYAGPGFINAPEPCMLPIPAFLVRAM